MWLKRYIKKEDKPDEPFVNSTTLFASELGLSSPALAPLVAQLQRICLLPSHFPEWRSTEDHLLCLNMTTHGTSDFGQCSSTPIVTF